MRTEPPNMLLAVWICIAFVAQAMATEYTFRPAQSNYGDWSNPDNWYPTGVPGANDTAIVTDAPNGDPLYCWVTDDQDVGTLMVDDDT